MTDSKTTTTTDTATAALTVWEIDPAHTMIELAVRHMMISTVKGRFSDVRGTVRVDDDEPTTAEIDVTVDAASIDTRQPDRDTHLRSADFLDVENHPEIHFRSTGVERTGEGRYRVTGDLTIRDTTREVVLDAEEQGRGTDPWGAERAGYRATARLDRRDFGLTWNQALETGGVLVGNEVRIAIETELIRQAD